MLTKITTLATVFTVLTAFTTNAQADVDHHNFRYRRLDDLAFSAFIDARELRWEIHDDFVNSHDYDHLLEDADAIVFAIRDLQSLILRERPDAHIAREIVNVDRKIANLTSHLNSCDFASVRRGAHRTTYGGNGYEFHPETRHVGRVHVDAALKMVRGIELAMHQLEREVSPRHHHGHREIIVPRNSAPQAPILVPPQSTKSTSFRREFPIIKTPDGKLTFRIGF